MTAPVDDLRSYNNKHKYSINVAYLLNDNKRYIIEKRYIDILKFENVIYKPYQENESKLNTILLEVFENVYNIENIYNNDFIVKYNIKLIIIPEIKYIFKYGSTWSPKTAVMDLVLNIYNTEHLLIAKLKITESQTTKYRERLVNHSVAGMRASQMAFHKMMKLILSSEKIENYVKNN